MQTHPSGRGRFVRTLAWAMHTPRRAALVAVGMTVTVLIVTIAVLALATRGGGQAARPGAAAVDRSSCSAVTTGFATDFFTDPSASGWTEKVARWVDPPLRDPVTSIDPADVPGGAVTPQRVDEQSGACDAFFTVAPGNLQVRVEASTTAADGQWYVTGWGTP